MPASKYHLTVSEKQKIIEIYDSLSGHSYSYVSREVSERFGRYVSPQSISNTLKKGRKLPSQRAFKDSNFQTKNATKCVGEFFGKMNQDNGTI